MIYEAHEPSSACRLWRIFQVETSTPPTIENNIREKPAKVKDEQTAVAS